MRSAAGALASDVVWARLAWMTAYGALALACRSDAARAEPRVRERALALAPSTASLRAERRPNGAPEVVRIFSETQDAIDETVRLAVERGDFPGAVVLIGRRDGVVFRRAYGALAELPTRIAARPDAVYDLASLTKPLVTATSIALLADDGRLGFDDPVSRHLRELAGSAHGNVTLRQLLLHASGLPAIVPVTAFEHGLAGALRAIARTRRSSEPGEQVLYSDLGFVLLGAVVERVAGIRLDAFASARVLEPLGMASSGFLPPSSARIAPTELRNGDFLRGAVHDPRAAALGGVAGHAGLYSSADDLARFARMMLSGGELDGKRVLSARAVRELTHGESIGEDRRALGWDVADEAHPGNLGPRAFGHGGFTGTSLWIDPDLDLFVIVLSNRLHPDGKGAVEPTAARVQALAANAARRGRITARRETRVATGIDVLVRDDFAALGALRIGLLTNAAARTRDGRTTAETLAQALGPRLVALFSPEHGLEARLEGAVNDDRDPRTGVVVRSLFGPARRPGRDALEGLDALVVDLPDVGARFYTYLSTMREALIAASELRLSFVVLDRPNPLGGEVVEGPSIDPERRSFVNHHPLPVRHGLTAGELARLLAAELGLAIEPRVIAVEGWRRGAHWPETGLPWVRPSPNLPSYDAALVYPGVALLEATNVSVGRGTDAPFERVGAPWIAAEALVRALDALGLRHVELRADHFVPRASVFAGTACHGVRIRVTDRERVRPVTVGLAIARELGRLHANEFRSERVEVLLAHRATLTALASGVELSELEQRFEPGLAAFRARRAPHLLY